MTKTIAAELSAAAEAIADYQRRVGALTSQVGKERDDLVTALDEAERSLGVAERSIRRAIKVAATG